MKHLFLATLVSLSLIACAHQKSVDNHVQAELRAEPSAPVGGEAAAASMKLIQESTTLNETQKQKLISLHTRMAAEAKASREELGKLKVVLVRTMLDAKSDEREIENLKIRILKADRKRTDAMLSALTEAREILGREARDEKMYRALISVHPELDFN